jgi:hypothetical protein
MGQYGSIVEWTSQPSHREDPDVVAQRCWQELHDKQVTGQFTDQKRWAAHALLMPKIARNCYRLMIGRLTFRCPESWL